MWFFETDCFNGIWSMFYCICASLNSNSDNEDPLARTMFIFDEIEWKRNWWKIWGQKVFERKYKTWTYYPCIKEIPFLLESFKIMIENSISNHVFGSFSHDVTSFVIHMLLSSPSKCVTSLMFDHSIYQRSPAKMSSRPFCAKTGISGRTKKVSEVAFLYWAVKKVFLLACLLN